MLDKIFNKKKRDEDIFCVPQRKNTIDIKNLSKLGPKALQQIVQQQEKYITTLTTRIEQMSTEFRKVKQKSDELQQKNDVINAQISKMSNQHEELTIKFDNLQNSLEIMIATNQQQLNSQLNFLKTQQNTFTGNQVIPKSIQQVFSMYQDRFLLCSKISQQNKFLKEKINDIELRFDEITERYEEAQKQKGFNSMIPSLMQSLQELKRERKNSNSLPANTAMINEIKNDIKEQVKSFTERETMTSQQKIQSPKQIQIISKECLSCIQLKSEIESLKQAKQSLMEDIGEWSGKCQDLQNLLNSIKGQKDQLETKLRQETKTFKLDVQNAQEQRKKLSQQTQKLRSSIDSLTQELQKFKTQNLQLQKLIQEKSIQATIKQAQLGKLSLRLSQLQSQSKNNKQQNVLEQTQKTQTLQQQKDTQLNQQLSSQQQQHRIKVSTQNNTAHYEERIKQLCLQNENSLQQILQLKQQLITKRSQLNKANDQLQKSTSQLMKTRQSLQQSEQLTTRTQQKYKKLMQQNQQDMLDKIKSLQTKISENEKQLIYLRNNKQTIQNDTKKTTKQKKLLQQAVKQMQTYKTDVQQRILPSLRSQLQTLKKQHQRICQQKQIIQQHNLQNMNSLNLSNQQLLKQLQTLRKDKTQIQTKFNQINKQLLTKTTQIQTFQQTINKLNRQTTEKLLVIEQLNSQIKRKSNQMEELYQQLKSKQRKYQSQLNQQRIKAQTMKRTISVQQTKLQQNQKSSNKLYQQSMHKDKKISYMEIKLKQYKHLIQSLKKEKDQLQKMFLQKMKNYQYQDTIPQVVSEEQLSTDRKRTEDKKQTSKSDGVIVEVHGNDKDTEYFKNQILSYEQSNMVLKQENSHLRDKIKELEDQIQDRKRQVQNLQEKRQQTLKQIEKLNIRSINGTLQPMSAQFTQKEKQFNKEKQELQADKQKSQQRMKKVALKAYKGFDILLKKHQSLYKDFIDVFLKQMADREEVKNIESEINSLINKSTDMKDIFQDYL